MNKCFHKWPLALAFGLASPALLQAALGALQWQESDAFKFAQIQVSPHGRTGFTLLSAADTGISFTNRLGEDRFLTNQIYLNGSGVAAGDVDGDGWCDLYFCGLDSPNVLYRNLGNWRFADVTASAGVTCADQASTGAVFADVDGDGDLDLLVNGIARGTRLFFNDGKGIFQESTESAGLGGRSGSMSMALADIDGDGDLDLYVVNYRSSTFRDAPDTRFKAVVTNNQYTVIAVDGRPATAPDLIGRYTIDPVAGILENGEADLLYRNDGHGRFIPMSWTDGSFRNEDGKPISIPYDWGLSAMFRDLNGDSAPDLYVCNDFHSVDRIWLNDGRGQFRALPRLAMRQTSLFSMGVDFADLDRDGYDEIFVADMLSREHARRQVQVEEHKFVQQVGRIESRPQYSRNTLFWNRGDGTYAEIASYSGIEASEWSWTPIFLDVDLDGFEDLLITTGHARDARDIDVARHIDTLKSQKRMSRLEELGLRKMFPKLDTPNVAFHNRGDLTFEEVGAAWGFNSRQISHGMCLADLDNDGDLDIAANCLNAEALVYRNDSPAPRLAVRLRGLPPNTQGIGAKIRILNGPVALQSQEIICGGRYLSGDDPMRVFAAGSPTNELTIEVHWRGGHRSRFERAKPNRVYEIAEPRPPR